VYLIFKRVNHAKKQSKINKKLKIKSYKKTIFNYLSVLNQAFLLNKNFFIYPYLDSIKQINTVLLENKIICNYKLYFWNNGIIENKYIITYIPRVQAKIMLVSRPGYYTHVSYK